MLLQKDCCWNDVFCGSRWNTDFRSALRSSRIDTTRQLAQMIAESSPRPKVWISASAIGDAPSELIALSNHFFLFIFILYFILNKIDLLLHSQVDDEVDKNR